MSLEPSRPQLELDAVPAGEATPFVTGLWGRLKATLAKLGQALEDVANLNKKVSVLQDEIRHLKGLTPRPMVKGSNLAKLTDKRLLEEQAGQKEAGAPVEPAPKRPGSEKASATAKLVIHEWRNVAPAQPVPAGSVLKEYRDYVVRDLRISAHNICVRREVWLTPSGEWLVGELPAEFKHSHFGVTLRSFILNQVQQCLVTQPLLREQLAEFGVSISSGQVNRILGLDIDRFEDEALSILAAGLKGSSAITADDTYAPHAGAAGFATNISGPLFAWYGSTPSKSRVSFLALLHAKKVSYCINGAALWCLRALGLAEQHLEVLRKRPCHFQGVMKLELYLTLAGIHGDEARNLVTEGALWGALVGKVHPGLAIVSDGAGQFVVGPNHGLCWIHMERLISNVLAGSDSDRAEQARVTGEVWELYFRLVAFKRAPRAHLIPALRDEFRRLFTQKTTFLGLNAQLARTYQFEDDLLLVLRRPDVPLHTNQSETDIREFVRKRKISGGTRSDLGRRCRNVYATLKKTCRKLGVSFWQFLQDRLQGTGAVAPLAETLAAALAQVVPVSVSY